ncbi:hypothetical protein CCUS01_03525 [Colletotrichum cuscutae]|uniref:Uncharacterized protein n=1 Tax=Colletotrichum cuscutae TaxID=1209917 RepID=A0AAI9VI04_9PEZI|nr:hypothetical protein CCUS01_03525 [Colletotrichum cuscutae]
MDEIPQYIAHIHQKESRYICSCVPYIDHTPGVPAFELHPGLYGGGGGALRETPLAEVSLSYDEHGTVMMDESLFGLRDSDNSVMTVQCWEEVGVEERKMSGARWLFWGSLRISDALPIRTDPTVAAGITRRGEAVRRCERKKLFTSPHLI